MPLYTAWQVVWLYSVIIFVFFVNYLQPVYEVNTLKGKGKYPNIQCPNKTQTKPSMYIFLKIYYSLLLISVSHDCLYQFNFREKDS